MKCVTRELGVYSTEDGLCQVSAIIEGGIFLPPAGTKPLSKLPLVWNWQRLHVVPTGKVRPITSYRPWSQLCLKSFLVFACASPEATGSTIQSSDSENDRAEETRVAVFELEIERRDDPDAISLTKIGDWTYDGPLEGIVAHRSGDGICTSPCVKDHQKLTEIRADASSAPGFCSAPHATEDYPGREAVPHKQSTSYDQLYHEPAVAESIQSIERIEIVRTP